MTTNSKDDSISFNPETNATKSSEPSEKASLNHQFLKEAWEQKAFDDDSLLMCLEILTGSHGRPTSSSALKTGLPLDRNRLTPDLFIRAAERAGLSARILRKTLADISPLTLPCVLILEGTKACLLASCPSSEEVEVIFPETGRGSKILRLEDLNQLYSGYVIFCHPLYRYDQRATDIETERPKNWFWGTLLKSWSIYAQVAVAAILVNLFAIVSPLFVMNVYDRVVPNNSTDTLWVLTTGVFVVFGFDLLLKTLRVYYVDLADKNADVILAEQLFERVLGMRLAYRPKSSGSFANQLREFETLREFFSSATLVAFIDLPFIFLFILLIGYIGGNIAWVPLLSVPIVIIAMLVLQGSLRSWVRRSFKEEAQKHALLVESISGLETIKSFGAENRMQRNWENFVSQSASSSNAVRFLGSFALNFAGFIQQLAYVLMIVAGVYLIAKGELSTGGLIACSILSGRVMAPLSQIVSLLSKLNHSRTALLRLSTKSLDCPLKEEKRKVISIVQISRAIFSLKM